MAHNLSNEGTYGYSTDTRQNPVLKARLYAEDFQDKCGPVIIFPCGATWYRKW